MGFNWMTETTYQVDVSLALSLEQIKTIILSMPPEEQNEIVLAVVNNRQSQDNSSFPSLPGESEKVNSDVLTVFERISKNAKAKGLTEEILEELLANES